MAGKKSPSIFSTLQKTTENASAVNGELTRQLPVASLVDNPMNRFSMAEDDEFLSTMRSVEQDGFLEDIVVTPDGENTWRIISGHRRVMAARKLGKTAVPCKVRRYPDKLSELRALMGANVHRRSLSPFDMARQLETLREVLSESGQLPEGTKEQAELMAVQSDLSRATVERYLDLLNLDETMTGWAERGEMTMTDAYEMARRKNVHLQAAVEEYVAHNNANGDFPGLVHRAIAWAKAAELPPPPPKPAPAANPLRTVDSFGRAVRRSTAQLKALDLSADVDRTTARKKLDTCLVNLEELRRTVEALKAGLDGCPPPLPRTVRAAQNRIEPNGNGTRTRSVTVILAVFPPIRQIIFTKAARSVSCKFLLKKLKTQTRSFGSGRRKSQTDRRKASTRQRFQMSAPASVQRFTKRMRLVMLLKSRSYSSLITKSWSSTILPEKRSI